MKRDPLKIHLNMEVETANLDTFSDAVYVTLSDTQKDWRFQTGQEAAKAVNCVSKLLWESVCCAASRSVDAITSKVSIEIQCPEFSGGFRRQLVKARSNRWSPELSKDIAQVSEQIRHELADMLQNNDFTQKTLIVADRGFESYNLIAHLFEKPNTDFLIRVKQNHGAMREIARLPMLELDCDIAFTITTTQTNEDKQKRHIFLQIPKKSKEGAKTRRGR